jgi:hypothetical protein
MTTRCAECSCGQLAAICQGDPVRISVCHCLACKRRSGSAFSNNARFPEARRAKDIKAAGISGLAPVDPI